MNEIINNGTGKSVGRHETIDESFYKLYRAVNEKSEELSKEYDEDILIEFKDIKNIHQKIIQSLNSFRCALNSLQTEFVLLHNNKERERFTEFEQFEQYNSSSPYATTELLMTYYFLLPPSQNASNPEKYKIQINLRSRVAKYDELLEEMPSFWVPMLNTSSVARIEIEYSDYIKAKAFISTFDEWVLACDKTENSKLFKKIRSNSHWVPRAGLPLLYLSSIMAAFSLAKNSVVNNISIHVFIVAFVGSLVLLSSVGGLLLKKIESSVDCFLVMSYIKLNSGDNNLIRKYHSRNKKSWLSGGISLIGTTLLGIFINYIYDYIKV